jgi:opacity protein-like surface antigen
LRLRGVTAALLLYSASATAAPYVTVRAGPAVWLDTSNHDGVESGTEVGSAVSVAVGDELGLSDIGLPKSDFALDAELEAGWRRHALHGRNRGYEHRSADGRDLDAFTLGANLWPGWQATRWLTLYAGGGGGIAFLRALGDSERAPYAQAGVGIRVNLTPALSVDLGGRALWSERTRHQGCQLTYDAVPSAIIGVRYEWK